MSPFKSRVKVYMGHGASGDASSMAPFVAGLRARGVDAVAIDLPKRKAEDASDHAAAQTHFSERVGPDGTGPQGRIP